MPFNFTQTIKEVELFTWTVSSVRSGSAQVFLFTVYSFLPCRYCEFYIGENSKRFNLYPERNWMYKRELYVRLKLKLNRWKEIESKLYLVGIIRDCNFSKYFRCSLDSNGTLSRRVSRVSVYLRIAYRCKLSPSVAFRLWKGTIEALDSFSH